MVARIQVSNFINMAELLLDRMGITATPMFLNERDEKQSRCRQVTTITEWVQCFSIYVAVQAAKQVEKIQDYMGYQALIIEACMKYSSDA